MLNLFISNFKQYCREVFLNLRLTLCYEKFEELFSIPIRDVDYLSCYIRLINQNYINFVEEKEEKFKLWRLSCFWLNQKRQKATFPTLTVDFFVSRCNLYVHMGLNRPLHSTENFTEALQFIEKLWNEKKIRTIFLFSADILK